MTVVEGEASNPSAPGRSASGEPAIAGVAGVGGSAQLAELLSQVALVLYVLLLFQPLARIVPIGGSGASMLIAAVGVAAVLLTPTERLARIPVSLGLLVMLGWAAVSVVWSEVPHMTRFGITSQLIPLVIMSVLVGTMRPAVVVRTLLGTALAVGAWSLLTSALMADARGAVLGAGPDDFHHGFRGTFIHKNLLGMFMVYGLCLVLPFVRSRARPWAMALCVGLVLSTRSATAGSGLMGVLFTWFWMLAVDNQRSQRERQVMLMLSFLSVVVGILLALGLMPTLLGLYGKDFTFSGRTYIWEASMEAIARQPLQGYGFLGVWGDAPTDVTRTLHQRIGFQASHAHNGAIEVLLQLGIVGTGLVLVFLVRIVHLAVGAFNDRSTAPTGQWVILTMTALLLMSISEPLFQFPDLGLLVIIFTVLMVMKNDRKRAQRTGAGVVLPHGVMR